MEVTNYEDVLIDVCPSCRGVWLDRGELQKIIAHVRRQEAEQPSHILDAPPPPAPPQREERAPREEREYRKEKDYHKEKKRKKKKGFWDVLEDIVDFD